MPPAPRGTLQLDFDGTLAHDDVSTGILAHFVGPEWGERVEAASRELVADPDSSALIDTMAAGYAMLDGSKAGYIRHARKHHPPRAGLPELITAAEQLGLECHVVSNGFEFYIREYLRLAGVDGRVQVHTGSVGQSGSLVYLGPDGQPAPNRFKLGWAEHFLTRHDLLVYVGDGSSDVAPAQLAGIVFARDSLLTRISESFQGTLCPFETLHDVARELEVRLA